MYARLWAAHDEATGLVGLGAGTAPPHLQAYGRARLHRGRRSGYAPSHNPAAAGRRTWPLDRDRSPPPTALGNHPRARSNRATTRRDYRLSNNVMSGSNGSYLEVTFRHGRPLAAYLVLPRRARDRSARTRRAAPGLVIDFTADGRPIGIEITAPSRVTV